MKISVLLFKDGLDVRMEIFSGRHGLYTFSPGVYRYFSFSVSKGRKTDEVAKTHFLRSHHTSK